MLLNKPIVVIQYPSLGQWLADRLAQAIAALDPTLTTPLGLVALPLFSQSKPQFGTLTSPLLLKLLRPEATSTAQALKAIFQQWDDQAAIGFRPKLWVHPNGWLYAHFDTDDFTHWLQQISVAIPALRPQQHVRASQRTQSISHEPALFAVQYAHARCCSLLRLGDHHIPSEQRGAFIWQNDAGELYLQTPTEQALLQALMQFPQSLSPQKVMYGCPQSLVPGTQTRLQWPIHQAHLRKQAEIWGELFSNFYRECRLFGDVQKTSPELVRARFALIYIVKTVLAFVLEDLFEIPAPQAL